MPAEQFDSLVVYVQRLWARDGAHENEAPGGDEGDRFIVLVGDPDPDPIRGPEFKLHGPFEVSELGYTNGPVVEVQYDHEKVLTEEQLQGWFVLPANSHDWDTVLTAVNNWVYLD